MLVNPEYDRAKKAILGILKAEEVPMTPAELLEKLDDQGFDNGISRGAIWALIDGNQIDFTFEQLLEYVKPAVERARELSNA